MRVLITGATGLLGGHLIKELQQRGEDIRALVLGIAPAVGVAWRSRCAFHDLVL